MLRPGVGFRDQSCDFFIEGGVFRVQVVGVRVQGSWVELRVYGVGFRVWSSGF